MYTDALQNLGGDSVNDLRFLTEDDLKGVRTCKRNTTWTNTERSKTCLCFVTKYY